MIEHNEISGLPEKYLMDNINNIKKDCMVNGYFTPNSKYENNFSTITEHNTLDFTNSFLFYMIENRYLLNFHFEIVDAPTYQVFYVDTMIKNNVAGINTGLIAVNVQPGVVKTRNTPTRATMEFLKNMNVKGVETIYNEILSDMNYMMLQRQEAAVYFFRLMTSKTMFPDDTVRFMARFGTSIKGMNNIKPRGELQEIPSDSPWERMRI